MTKSGIHTFMACAAVTVLAAVGTICHAENPIIQTRSGPWRCKGSIMDLKRLSDGNHPGIIDFKGHLSQLGDRPMGPRRADGFVCRHGRTLFHGHGRSPRQLRLLGLGLSALELRTRRPQDGHRGHLGKGRTPARPALRQGSMVGGHGPGGSLRAAAHPDARTAFPAGERSAAVAFCQSVHVARGRRGHPVPSRCDLL